MFSVAMVANHKVASTALHWPLSSRPQAATVAPTLQPSAAAPACATLRRCCGCCVSHRRCCACCAEEALFLEMVVPAPINKFLRSYQREGVRFLARQYASGTGGVLADDMGLGE